MIVLLGLGELEICLYLLDLAGDHGMEKPVKRETWKGGRCSSMRSGNEKGGNGKGWQKCSQIWLVGNLFVKEPSQYLTCFEKAILPAFLISGLLAFEIAQMGILKFWYVLAAYLPANEQAAWLTIIFPLFCGQKMYMKIPWNIPALVWIKMCKSLCI